MEENYLKTLKSAIFNAAARNDHDIYSQKHTIYRPLIKGQLIRNYLGVVLL